MSDLIVNRRVKIWHGCSCQEFARINSNIILRDSESEEYKITLQNLKMILYATNVSSIENMHLYMKCYVGKIYNFE